MEMTPDLQPPKPQPLYKTLGRSLLKYWLGGFNGIQVFIFPVLLLYWLDALELLHVVSEILTFKMHYLPLCIFLFLAVYVLFIIAKYYVSAPHTKAEFKLFIIELHKYLLTCLFCFAILFLLAIFLKYFYGILISEKAIASWTARGLGIFAILISHLSHSWTEPWQKLGHSFPNALARVRIFARHHPYRFHTFNLLHIFLILLFCRAYINWQDYIYYPIFHALGLDFKLNLISVSSTIALSINVILVTFAALCSSFFFIPLVWLATQITRFLHPIKPRKYDNQPIIEQINEQTQEDTN